MLSVNLRKFRDAPRTFFVVAAQRRSAGPTHRSLAFDAIVPAAYERIADLRCAMRQVRKAAVTWALRHLVANRVIRVRSAAASAVRANHWSKARAIDRLAILDPTRVNSRRRRVSCVACCLRACKPRVCRLRVRRRAKALVSARSSITLDSACSSIRDLYAFASSLRFVHSATSSFTCVWA